MAYLEKGEVAHELPWEKVTRRLKFWFAQKTNGTRATGLAKQVLEELDDRIISSENEVERKARQAIKDNTLGLGDEITQRPSCFHRDTFLRDLYAVCRYADSPSLIRAALDMFADVQDQETGYTQTSIFAFGRAGHTFLDETTFYPPILAYQAVFEHGMSLTPKEEKAARLSTDYTVRQIDQDGLIRNKSERRTYWADELILPPEDVVSNKQGWGILALKAALRLGYLKDRYVIEKAEDGLRKIVQKWGGRLPLSLLTGWIDVSALSPEASSILLFGEGMLDDWMVKNTVESFVTAEPYYEDEEPDIGLRVIRDRDGSYLKEENFIHPDFGGEFMDRPGNYQCGGSWSREEYRAWVATKLHGVDLSFLPPSIRAVFNEGSIMRRTFVEYDLPESFVTGRFRDDPLFDPERTGHILNVEILDLQRRVRAFMQAKAAGTSQGIVG